MALSRSLEGLRTAAFSRSPFGNVTKPLHRLRQRRRRVRPPIEDHLHRCRRQQRQPQHPTHLADDEGHLDGDDAGIVRGASRRPLECVADGAEFLDNI